MNASRIFAIAYNGFQEIIRDKILYLIGLFAFLLTAGITFLPEIAVGTQDKIILDLGLGLIGFLTAIVAIFIGTSLINKEIEKRTILVLIPKPIKISEFIIGKHLGLSAVLTVLILVMGLIYFILLSLSHITFPLTSISLSLLFLLIELILITAVTITFGVFTSSILAVLLSFGVYLMGHFSQDLVELGKISKNTNIEFFTQTLYLVLPDLSRLNLRNEAVYGLLPSTTDLVMSCIYGFFYTGLLLTVAILVFSRKEF